jgi:hypothetical protein
MKQMSELPELMNRILNGSWELYDNSGVFFSPGALSAIHEIAEYSRKTNCTNYRLSDLSIERVESALFVWELLLASIVFAPNNFCRENIILVLIAHLDDRLSEKCSSGEQ